ncbi:unnamed protein product [Candida verbasci]|uniref:Cysteine dioxygenase n=1 Tax=Candida verbasci TaxID=1227364 RepID=A0A9W4TTD0_9ASCO|nr:unnamed protein product [Candida verbasci]
MLVNSNITNFKPQSTPSSTPNSAISCSLQDNSTPRYIPNQKEYNLTPKLDHGYEKDGTNIDLPFDSEFYQLILKLKNLLKGKGLSSDEIDIEKCKKVMESYKSNEFDWGKFALHDSSRNYSRNGIINLNGNANLLILVWSPGKSSAIHDHANAHCCMKILKGDLIEHLYDIPKIEGESKLICKQQTLLKRDEVGYISDSIGLHKISNPNSDVSVSLHLYTPPYASLYGCSMYEASNGKKHHVDMSKYYSWQGKLINEKNSSTC